MIGVRLGVVLRRAVGAGVDAARAGLIDAVDALRRSVQPALDVLEAFGVGAPLAPEGAAGQEDERAASGAVVHAVRLDVEDPPFECFVLCGERCGQVSHGSPLSPGDGVADSYTYRSRRATGRSCRRPDGDRVQRIRFGRQPRGPAAVCCPLPSEPECGGQEAISANPGFLARFEGLVPGCSFG